MSRVWRTAFAVLLTFGVIAAALPAAADPEGDHVGPGSSGPDEHTRNIKLLAHLEKSAPSVTQSDLAFDGKLMYAGNYRGFRVIDISDPENPVVISNFECNGLQGDISVYQGLAFQSVDQPQSDPSCSSTNVNASTPGAWEGVRVFDVSDPTNPVHLDSYKTDCGSHTLAPNPETNRLFIYVSSYPLTRANIGPESNCFNVQSGGGHGYVSIIEVPLDDPTDETVHKYFLDPATEVATFDLDGALGLPPGTLGTSSFVACHDISVFTELDLAAGACMSEAQVWDISDPANPQFLWRFDDPALDHENDLSLWHSSAFSWDGTVVAFGDENGGGALPRCVDPNDQRGRVWFLDTETGGFLANYKIPRSEPGICTSHNFNFIPQTRGRKTLVMANYTAGMTVVDVNALLAGASEADAEIGFYKADGTDQWSAYWYNGFIYSNDITRGVDVFLLSDRARAGQKKLPTMNPQTQISVIR